jgi:hypothetical protein
MILRDWVVPGCGLSKKSLTCRQSPAALTISKMPEQPRVPTLKAFIFRQLPRAKLTVMFCVAMAAITKAASRVQGCKRLGQMRRLKAVFGHSWIWQSRISFGLRIAQISQARRFVSWQLSEVDRDGRRERCALSPDDPALSPARSPIDPPQLQFHPPRILTSLCLRFTRGAIIRGTTVNKSGEAPPAMHAAQSLVLPVSAPLTSTPRRLDTSSPFLAVEAKAVAVLD